MKKTVLAMGILVLIIILIALLSPSNTSLYEAKVYSPTPSVSPSPTPTPVYAEATPQATSAISEYVLRSKNYMDEYHEDVALIQARLKELGYYAGEADGFYGDSTFSAIVAFQRNNGLEIDGIAGVETQKVLFESEDVYDASGRIYVPFTGENVTPSPTPTPEVTIAQLPFDDFSAGASPNTSLLGGTVYPSNAIDASISTSDGLMCVKIRISHASQLRSALSGSVQTPTLKSLESVSKANNAIVAFAAGDFINEPKAFEVRQSTLLTERAEFNSPLMVIDRSGDVHLFSPYGAEKGVKELGENIYQALTVQKNLIINGIVQADLSETPEHLLVFAQTDELEYMLVYSDGVASEREICDFLSENGADCASIIGSGGIYTCFGSLTEYTYADDKAVCGIIYFADTDAEG